MSRCTFHSEEVTSLRLNALTSGRLQDRTPSVFVTPEHKFLRDETFALTGVRALSVDRPRTPHHQIEAFCDPVRGTAGGITGPVMVLSKSGRLLIATVAVWPYLRAIPSYIRTNPMYLFIIILSSFTIIYRAQRGTHHVSTRSSGYKSASRKHAAPGCRSLHRAPFNQRYGATGYRGGGLGRAYREKAHGCDRHAPL